MKIDFLVFLVTSNLPCYQASSGNAKVLEADLYLVVAGKRVEGS